MLVEQKVFMSNKSAIKKLHSRLRKSFPRLFRQPSGPGYHRLDDLPSLETIVDIGVGHQGSFFLYDRFPNSYFISIDPLSEAEKIVNDLINNGRLNGCFIRAAAGKETKEVSFTVSSSPSQSSLFQRTRHNQHSRAIESRTTTVDRLDNLLGKIHIQRPALLKADVEGGEYDCLLGATQTLEMMDYIILELPLTANYHDAYRFSDAISLLANYRFEAYQVLKASRQTMDLLFTREDDPVRTPVRTP